MSFKFIIKPKIKLSKLFKDKEIEYKSIDTKIECEQELEDDVTFNAKLEMNLNYQKPKLGIEDRCKFAKFSFTKKF